MGKRKTSLFRKFLYILETIIVVPLASLVGLLPWKAALALADFFAGIIIKFDKNNRKWANMNLDIIFKENPLSQREKDAIISRCFRQVARYGIEYLKLGRVNAKNYQKFARFEGYENVEKALAEGKGLIVVTAHLGNWEYLGGIPAKLGVNLGVIINRQFNPYTDAWLRRLREKKGGIKCFYNEINDISRLVKHIRGGGTIGILADQTYYFKPIFVPFFGMPSATADGPARFHLKYKSPLMMAFSIREPDGRYLLKYEPAVHFEPTGDYHKDAETIMTWINSRFEEYIKKYPDQWFSLFHGRWERTKPEDFNDIEWDPF